MKTSKSSFIVGTLLFTTAMAEAQVPFDPAMIDKRVDQYVVSLMDAYQIPGVALAIVKDNKIFKDKAYGVKNLKTKDPLTAESIFHIGNLTFGVVDLMLGYEPPNPTIPISMIMGGMILNSGVAKAIGNAILGENQPKLWKIEALRQNVRIQAHETDRVANNGNRVINNGNRVANNGNVELHNVDVARHNANMCSHNRQRGPYEMDRVYYEMESELHNEDKCLHNVKHRRHNVRVCCREASVELYNVDVRSRGASVELYNGDVGSHEASRSLHKVGECPPEVLVFSQRIYGAHRKAGRG
jgi:hypothetical protein